MYTRLSPGVYRGPQGQLVHSATDPNRQAPAPAAPAARPAAPPMPAARPPTPAAAPAAPQYQPAAPVPQQYAQLQGQSVYGMPQQIQNPALQKAAMPAGSALQQIASPGMNQAAYGLPQAAQGPGLLGTSGMAQQLGAANAGAQQPRMAQIGPAYPQAQAAIRPPGT